MQICQDTGKPIVEISHSGLNTFASCPKRFAFRKIIVSGEDEDRSASDATEAGTAFHEGLQEYMRSRDIDKAYEAVALHHHIQLHTPDRASNYSLEAVCIALRYAISPDTMPEAGGMNITDYELATFIRDGVPHPATEVPFLVKIERPKLMFHLRGFIDLVVKHPTADRFMAVDIKTTTPQGLSRNFEQKYQWDWQCTSYGIPLAALLGVHDAFDVGIYGVALSDREPSVRFPVYHRNVIDIEDYQFYLLDKCRQIEEYYIAQRFPRQPSGCVSFNRPCYYMNACRASTLDQMQNEINPSGKPGAPSSRRPHDPLFTAVLTP